MSIVVIGGGPHPQARIVALVNPNDSSQPHEEAPFAIFDGAECLALFKKLSHAQALLPYIQSGE